MLSPVAKTSLTVLGLSLGAATVYGLTLRNRALASLQPPPYTIPGLLVSVIVPTIQEEDYLPQLLTSIDHQTYTNTEVLISDSTAPSKAGPTLELVQNWSGHMPVKFVSLAKKNVSAGRNFGAQNAQGAYYLFLDADCILEANYIEKMVRDLSLPNCHLAHGLDAYYDANFWNTLKVFYLVTKPRMHTTGRGVLMRSNDFALVGAYDENLDPSNSKAREDLDLGQRVEKLWGPGAVYLDRSAVVAETHRRPIGAGFTSGRVWDHRGWRSGTAIDAGQFGLRIRS